MDNELGNPVPAGGMLSDDVAALEQTSEQDTLVQVTFSTAVLLI